MSSATSPSREMPWKRWRCSPGRPRSQSGRSAPRSGSPTAPYIGCRAGLAGRAWLRAGHRFLSTQTDLIDAALNAPDGGGVAAVVAAADAPAVFAERYPASSQLLLTVRREELLGPETPTEIATQLHELDTLLVVCMVRLARAVWHRKDAAAVDVITACIVDLPTAILLHRNRINDPDARERLRAAVRAVLAVGAPPVRRRR